jgi:DNA repair protein RecN (Recombination protein N)
VVGTRVDRVLEEIRIQGLGVIADAVLEFGPGLTVVTGETGAGKTMILTGLALLFGERADSSRLRPGVDSASVEGRIRLDAGSASEAILTDAGGAVDDDGSLLLRRVVTAAGRSRAAAGGASVPSTVLSRLATELLAVHGQSDQQRLVRPAEQRRALDRYAGVDVAACAAAFARWRAAEDELATRTNRARELAREADLLRFGIAEVAAVAPERGEDLEIDDEIGRLQHADALRVAARTAHDLLLGDPEDSSGELSDAQTLIGTARKALTQVAGTDSRLDALADRLSEVVAAVSDLGAELADYQTGLDADPIRLATLHDRRAALANLIRKYGPDLSAVIEWAEAATEQLETLDTSEEALAALRQSRDRARSDYIDAASAVSTTRASAADELSEQVTAELQGLAMPNARLITSLRPRSPIESQPHVVIGDRTVGASVDGFDEVEILLQPHSDSPALPVQRGASGGELSRVMLALEVVLAGADPVPTMVFDEVDAGVGGRAAVEVGRRLARLAATHQVIVVTHLAQVASFADHHVVVDKHDRGSDGITRSDIRTVTGEDRVGELARMLAGDDTAVARRHAAELLGAAFVGDSSEGGTRTSPKESSAKGRLPKGQSPQAESAEPSGAPRQRGSGRRRQTV